MKNFSTCCSCVFLLRKTELLCFSPLAGYCGQQVYSHSSFFSSPALLIFVRTTEIQANGFCVLPSNKNLVGSVRREQTGIWKQSFLRKSDFPCETTQGTDSESLRARVSLDILCISEHHLWSLWTHF